MKKIFLQTLSLFLTLSLAAQHKPKLMPLPLPAPLIIQGRLTDCPEKFLKIFFTDKNNQLVIDTIHLDKDGSFYLKTSKIQNPQKTSIQQNNIQINDFYVAPGYNLTITGNGKDFRSLLKVKFTGVGAESNQYHMIYDSILLARNDTTRYYDLNEEALIKYIKKNKALKDSVAHVAFDRKATQDKYLAYFGKMVRLDNTFNDLYMLLLHTNLYKYNYDNSLAFIKNNFDNNILANLYRDEYMISDFYKGSVMGAEYLNYLVRLDQLKDATVSKRMNYKLEKINITYKGAIKQYILYSKMASAVEFANSFNTLNGYKEAFKPYVAALVNPASKKALAAKFSAKEADLLKTQIGKPAPKFTLKSNTNEAYSLDDFKGKVVYLDLWASWCGPCRAETPAFRALYSKYKNDNRVAFISIAVSDGINEWKKALGEDKPEWLQLLDKEGKVSLAYVANMIPKFVLISKEGNILSFDAPPPSSGLKIEALLNAEMDK